MRGRDGNHWMARRPDAIAPKMRNEAAGAPLQTADVGLIGQQMRHVGVRIRKADQKFDLRMAFAGKAAENFRQIVLRHLNRNYYAQRKVAHSLPRNLRKTPRSAR